MAEAPDAIDKLYQAAEAAQRADNFRELERLAKKMIAACEPSRDPRLALGYHFLGICYGRKNDARKSREHHEKALELFKASNDRRGALRATVGLAYIYGEIEVDPTKARRFSEEALALARELGDPEYLAVTTGNLAEVCRADGDYASALRYAGESAQLYAGVERFARASAQHSAAAHIHAVRGDYARSGESMRAARELLQKQPIAVHIAWYFEVWFMIAATRRKWEAAAKLYGFVNHYRDANDARRLQGVLPRMSSLVESVFSELGTTRTDRLMHEGELLSVDDASSLAETLV